MNIAVFHNLPFGGALRSLNGQIRHLNGAVKDVYTFSKKAQHPALDISHIHRYNIHLTNLYNPPFGRINGLVNLRNLKKMQNACKIIAHEIDSKNYDIVIVGACRITQTSPILQYLKTPTIYDCPEPFRGLLEAGMNGGPLINFKDPFRHLYSISALKNEYMGLLNASSVVCNSYYTRECVLRSYNISAIVNHRGIELELFHPLNLPKENFVVSVGRLTKQKKHDFIAESISLIPQSIRPELHIVCESTNECNTTALKELCKKLNVVLVIESDTSDKHLIELYNRAKATVYAPILEPLGLVPLESMACGTPVVSIAEAGMRETIINGTTGYLTNRDTYEFSEAIKNLVTRPDLAKQMGADGRKYMEDNWSWEKSIARLQNIIDKTLEGKHHE